MADGRHSTADAAADADAGNLHKSASAHRSPVPSCSTYRLPQLTVQLITPCSTKEKRLNSPPKGFRASITLYLEFPGQ